MLMSVTQDMINTSSTGRGGGVSPLWYGGRGLKLTTHLHPVPGKNGAAIPPLPHTSSWCDNLYLADTGHVIDAWFLLDACCAKSSIMKMEAVCSSETSVN
jgi:hypothetical protein